MPRLRRVRCLSRIMKPWCCTRCRPDCEVPLHSPSTFSSVVPRRGPPYVFSRNMHEEPTPHDHCNRSHRCRLATPGVVQGTAHLVVAYAADGVVDAVDLCAAGDPDQRRSNVGTSTDRARL